MATGDNVIAGASTTAESTTELVAEAVPGKILRGHPRRDFAGDVILKVGPQTAPLSPAHDVDGVEAHGANGGTGVSGVGGPSNGIGVRGVGGPDPAGQSGGPGVMGLTGGVTPPVQYDTLGAGVYGKGGTYGVVGVSDYNTGVYGAVTYASSADPGGSFAGFFAGPVYVSGHFGVHGNTTLSGNFVVFGGNKNVAVPFPDGTHRLLYCMESPESWFEDFGEAKLVKGRAQLKLTRDFAAVIRTGSYHVFLTPYGHSNGLYVSLRNNEGFVVNEQSGGKSTIKFSYRIVGRRKDVKGERFAKVAFPKLPDRPNSPLEKAAKTKMKGKAEKRN